MEEKINKRLKQKRELIRFGYSFGIGMAILTGVFVWKGHFVAAGVSGFLSFYHMVLSFFAFWMLYPTFRIVTSVAGFVGWLVTTILFGTLYYIFITPIAFLVRMGGKDHLSSKFVTKTSWVDRTEDREDSITKQY